MDQDIKISKQLLWLRSGRQLWISAGFVLLCLTVFLMPFPRSWSLYSLGLSMVAGLLAWMADYGTLKRVFLKRLPFNLPPIFYFLIILINYLLRSMEWKYLEGYLMFLLVPLFCFPIFVSDYSQKKRDVFIKAFIYGLLIICLFEFLCAFFGWNINTNSTAVISFDPESYASPFRSQRLSFLEHPTYLSMKVLFAICIIIIAGKEINLHASFSLILLPVLIIFLYFLSSRTSYLAFILIFIFLLYRFLIRFRLQFLVIILAPLILFGAYKVYSLNPRIINKTELLKKRYSVDTLKFKDLDPRFTSWFTAVDLIKQYPFFGVGLDARDILADEYRKNGYNNEANLRLNAHNQFLETQLTLGIPGSLVLFWMLFAPFFRKKEVWKTELYYSFMIILITAFIFESVLVRQWGIMFFTVFYCFQVNTRPDMGQNLL
jgi:O-antigen ligase